MHRFLLAISPLVFFITCGTGSSSEKSSEIIKWTADFNQISLGSQKVTYNHISYSKESGNLLIEKTVFQNQVLSNPNVAEATVSTDTKQNLDLALDSLVFSKIKNSYSSGNVESSDSTNTTITLFTQDNNKSISCGFFDTLPAGLQTLYTFANSQGN